MTPNRPLHSVTWLVWAVGAAATVQLAPSPVYVVLVIGVAALVVEVHAVDTGLARAFPTLVAVGIAFALLRVVLTALTTHEVGRTLFRLPEARLPRMLGGFTVGGSVELEVVLQSAAEGLAIVGVMAAFGAFNAVVSHYELVHAAPRAFYEPGLIVTVALAFVPSTLTALAAVREADRARTGGRVVRRGRLVRQVVPVLEGGMERAMHLAESMDARGFASSTSSRSERLAGVAGIVSLLGLGGAFVALVARERTVALVLGIAGALAMTAAAARASRASGRPRYRPRRLSRRDWTVGATLVGAPVVFVVLTLTGDPTLRWQPADVPRFNALAGIAIALLAVPALWSPGKRT